MNETRGLWRGKTTPKRNDEEFNSIWVEGDLIHSEESCYIHPFANAVKVQGELGRLIVMHEVDPSTLGECTGLTDKNGKLIFEGDILGFDSASGSYDLVEYHNGVFGVRLIPEDGGENYSCCEFPLWEELSDCVPAEIVGNIHDNPELLNTDD